MTRSIASERFQAVSRRRSHIVDARSDVKLRELAQGGALDFNKAMNTPQLKERFGIRAFE